MGKLKSLRLMLESKQVVKLVFTKSSFSFIGDAGVSSDFSEKEVVDLLAKLNIPSYDQLVNKAKTIKTHQVELEIADKDVKKLELK